MPWQQLKTGFSERPTHSQQHLADSSSSLAFAIACHKSSGPQGHSIFIDLRNREEERVEVKDQQDKHHKDAHDLELKKSAEMKSQATFENIQKGNVRRLLAKWFKAIQVKFNLLMSGKIAMEEWRKQIKDKQEKERKAAQEKNEIEGTEKRRRMRASAQVKERENARLQKSDPAELIQKVKNMWKQHCNTITSKELGSDKGNKDEWLLRKELTLETGSRACDIFDVCAISFFRNVLLPRNVSLDIILVPFTILFNCAGTSPKPCRRFMLCSRANFQPDLRGH